MKRSSRVVAAPARKGKATAGTKDDFFRFSAYNPAVAAFYNGLKAIMADSPLAGRDFVMVFRPRGITFKSVDKEVVT